VNVFRRLSLYHLLLLCGLVIALGASLAALALALGSGTKPPAKPLAQAVHDALEGAGGDSIKGVSANIKLTNHLLEGTGLATGEDQAGGLLSNPLLSGASGRLWIARDGRVRLELQAERGDTQVLYDGSTVSVYDASTNTLYRYKIPPEQQADRAEHHHEVPPLAKIEEGLDKLSKHALVSGATPANVAGRPAYTVRVAPREGGSLIGGAELSFDAANGVPLRGAIYSSRGSDPVVELAATEVSFGPVEDSVFSFTPPAGVKVEEVVAEKDPQSGSERASRPKLSTHGTGVTAIELIESRADAHGGHAPEGLPQVDINGTKASELKTALGTVLSFERSGVRYLVASALDAGAIEAFARGL
jgi:outer membrane lipoprotein-sorting protein